MIAVVEKNQKKEKAKKYRLTWNTIARPVTQTVPNRKKKSRQELKTELRRRVSDESFLFIEDRKPAGFRWWDVINEISML